jgi:hypothetical protein
MTFADNLKKLAPVDRLDRLALLDAEGNTIAEIRNKPGQAGSLAVYHHLYRKHGKIDATAAREGLELYAEHAGDAELNPGKHPNIDRLYDVIAEDSSLQVRIHPKT